MDEKHDMVEVKPEGNQMTSLKVRETLTRIGVASRKEKRNYSSPATFFIRRDSTISSTSKELFALDGKKRANSLRERRAETQPYHQTAVGLGTGRDCKRRVCHRCSTSESNQSDCRYRKARIVTPRVQV